MVIAHPFTPFVGFHPVYVYFLMICRTSLKMPGVPDFCFPNGVRHQKLKRTKSCSQFLEVICTHSAEKQFVFLLTTMEREHLYGMCVLRNEILEVSCFATITPVVIVE